MLRRKKGAGASFSLGSQSFGEEMFCSILPPSPSSTVVRFGEMTPSRSGLGKGPSGHGRPPDDEDLYRGIERRMFRSASFGHRDLSVIGRGKKRKLSICTVYLYIGEVGRFLINALYIKMIK